MDFAINVTFSGVAIVFLALLSLIFLIVVQGKISIASEKRKARRVEKQAAKAAKNAAKQHTANAESETPSVAPVAEVSPTVPQSDSGAVVAAIAAAVYALGAAEGKAYTVRSVRAGGRNVWAAAGVQEAVRPF